MARQCREAGRLRPQRERIRRRKYKTREEARQDVFPHRACYPYPAGQRTTSSFSTPAAQTREERDAVTDQL
jgi:hypothetical protein